MKMTFNAMQWNTHILLLQESFHYADHALYAHHDLVKLNHHQLLPLGVPDAAL